MASGGSSKQSSKPVFAQGQKDVAGAILQQILLPSLFGGAPDVATEAGINRSMQGLNQQVANQGLNPRDPLALKMATDVQKGALEARSRQRFDYINRVFAPLGQQSSGSSTQVGVGSGCWVAEAIWGVDHDLTHAARRWATTHDNLFTRAYARYGQAWAKVVERSRVARTLAYPIWRLMAYLGGK